MTHSLLDRAVARVAGESFTTIRRRGFSLLDPTRELDDLRSMPRPRGVSRNPRDAHRLAFLPQWARCHRTLA